MSSIINQRLINSVPWAIFDGVFSFVYSLGMVVLLGIMLTPYDLGLATVALAFTQVAETVYSGGLHEAVVRAPASHVKQSDTAHTLAVTYSLVAFVLCFFVAWLLSTIYTQSGMFILVIAAGLILPINALFLIPTALLSRKMRTSVLSSRTMISKAFAAATFAIGCFMGLGAWSIILSSLASSLSSLILIYLRTKRWPKIRIERKDVRQLLGYSIVSSLGGLCWMATTRVFLLGFGYLHGVSHLGSLQFAMRLVDELAALLQIAVQRVGLTYFSSLIRGKSDLKNVYLLGSRLLNSVSAFVYTIVIFLAPSMLRLVFGDKWNDAIPIIIVLSISWILVFPQVMVLTVLKALGRPAYSIVFSMITGIFAFVVSIATASSSEVVTAVGWGVAQVASIPLQIWTMQKYLDIPISVQLKQAVPAYCAALGLGATLYAVCAINIGVHVVAQSLLAFTLGVGSYLFLLSIFDGELVVAMRSAVPSIGQRNRVK